MPTRVLSADALADYDDDDVVGGDRTASKERRQSRFSESVSSMLEETEKDAAVRRASKEPARPCYIIDPRWKWKMRWDLLLGFFIVYSVVTIPYRLAYSYDPEGMIPLPNGGWFPWERYLDYVVDISFGLDICLCFNCGFMEDDEKAAGEVVVYNPSRIRRRYLKTWFLIDFFSTFPFELVAQVAFSGMGMSRNQMRSLRVLRVARLLRLLKLARLFKIARLVQSLEHMLRLPPSFMRLLKLFGKVFFIIHMLGCAWFGIVPTCPSLDEEGEVECGLYLDPLRDSWVNVYQVYAFPRMHQWWISCYWITTTMMGVGYGEISPQSTRERIFSLFIQLVGATVFGFIIANITSLLENLNPRVVEQKKKEAAAREWMHHRDVPKNLRNSVRSHYDYCIAKNMYSSDTELQGVLSMVPSRLKTAVAFHIHKERKETTKFIRNKSDTLVASVVFAMKPLCAQMSEVLVCEDEIVVDVYFISKGMVHGTKKSTGPGMLDDKHGVVHEASTKEVVCAIYESGDQFCDVETILDQPAKLDYKAWCQTDLFTVSKADLDKIEGTDELKADVDKHLEALEAVMREEETVQLPGKTLMGPGLSQKKKDQLPSVDLKASVVWRGREKFYKLVPHETVLRDSIMINEGEDDGEHSGLDEAEILKLWIIPPSHPKKVVWDMFVGALIVYSVLSIPFIIGFRYPVEYDDSFALWFLNIMVDVMFGVDMLASSRTAYVDPELDQLVSNAAKIRRNYLKSWFLIDFFSTVPIDKFVMAFFPGNGSDARTLKMIRILRLVRLLKLFRLMKMNKIITVIEREVDIDPIIWRLMTLFAQMGVCAHLLGCFWFFHHNLVIDDALTALAAGEDPVQDPCALGVRFCLSSGSGIVFDAMTTPVACLDEECLTASGGLRLRNIPTWYNSLAGESKHHSDVLTRYVSSLYWAYTTMTTVGYGDITPTTTFERIFAVIAMFFGASLFGYVIGSIASLMENGSGMSGAAKKRVLAFRDCLEEHNTDFPLTQSILKEFEYRMEMKPHQEDELLAGVPPRLRIELQVYVRRDPIRNVAIFYKAEKDKLTGKDKLTQAAKNVISWLIGSMQPYYFVTGDHVVGKGAKQTSMICLIEGMAEEVYFDGSEPDGDGKKYDTVTDLFTPGGIVSPHLLLYDDTSPHFYVRCITDVAALSLEASDLSKQNVPRNIFDHLVDALVYTIDRQERNRTSTLNLFMEERTKAYFNAAKTNTIDQFRRPVWKKDHSCHEVLAWTEPDGPGEQARNPAGDGDRAEGDGDIGSPGSPAEDQVKAVRDQPRPRELPKDGVAAPPKSPPGAAPPRRPEGRPPDHHGGAVFTGALGEVPSMALNLPNVVFQEEDADANHLLSRDIA
jgi:hypothetical protein